jgi:hypothetical protein
MRTSIDIPDEIYRQIKIQAAERGVTLREILLESFEKNQAAPEPKKKFVRPVIHSKRKDKFNLTNEQIYDLIGFP